MSDVGKYSAEVSWQDWSIIEVSGDTISEIDINVLQTATLTALANLNKNAVTTNTNLFTHLHAQRVLELVRGGADFQAGATQALAELNEAFYLSLSGLSDLAHSSLSASADSADRDDGALLVLSAALSVRNQVSGDITLLTSDFAGDGQFNGGRPPVFSNVRFATKSACWQLDAVSCHCYFPGSESYGAVSMRP